jgi:hypothetical protein
VFLQEPKPRFHACHSLESRLQSLECISFREAPKSDAPEPTDDVRSVLDRRVCPHLTERSSRMGDEVAADDDGALGAFVSHGHVPRPGIADVIGKVE